MKPLCTVAFVGLLVAPSAALAQAADDAAFTRKQDVVYGRKFGTALTMDVFTPRKPNGAAVVWVVSGGWVSSHAAINPGAIKEFLDRGYTVFAVCHGCQPKFTIPEILDDLHRAVRFIRHHAKEYGIDPERIGITGGSAGGHLALMQGTAGDKGKADAKDPIDRASSRVQAVACFFPPTDFLNYGGKDKFALDGLLARFKAPFDFREFDAKAGVFVPVGDREKVLAISRQVSPITHVSADDAPTLIVHGDADVLVPIGQAEAIVAKLKEAGVPAELVVKKGAAHGWKGMEKDRATMADWFDKYLRPAGPK
jgi:acetyl esterase/lipase